MKRKVLAAILALTMVFGLAACGSKGASSDGGSSDSGSGDLIKVGIINNDPNESGYRTANDKDMKEMFTKENGYDASFAYSLKNDCGQITAAQKFVRTVLIIFFSAADTATGSKGCGMTASELSYSTHYVDADDSYMKHLSYLIWTKKARQQLIGCRSGLR